MPNCDSVNTKYKNIREENRQSVAAAVFLDINIKPFDATVQFV